MPSSEATISKRRSDSAAGKRRSIDTRNERLRMAKLGDLLKVERSDIQDFPRESVDMILYLQKKGWRAQRSNRNHVMLLAPDGETRFSVSRNANSARYLSEDIRRYENGDKLNGLGKETLEKMNTEVVEVVSKKFPCPQKDCPQSYISQEKLDVHIAVTHEGYLECPECDEIRESKRVLGIHRSLAHGYESPKKAQRKEYEARKAKEIADRLKVEGLPPNATPNIKFDSSFVKKTAVLNVPVESVSVSSVSRYTDDTIPQLKESLKSFSKELDPVDLDFIDDRDSWTLDMSQIQDLRIIDVVRTLHAAGLKLEMRSWKPNE